MARTLTKPERAQRYLEASRAAESSRDRRSQQAARRRMEGYEAAYPNVAEHAIFGAPRHFPRNTEPGLFEHQRELRMTHLTSPEERRTRQRQLDNERNAAAGRRRQAQTAGPRAAAAGARAAGGAIGDVTGGGNLVLWVIGAGLLLALLYLLVAGKGTQAVAGLTGLVTAGAHSFINPKADPLADLERALGAKPISQAATSSSTGSSAPAKGGTPEMKSYLAALAKHLGWGSTQVAAWEQVIERESGWNPNAANKETGAYGIGQINPENAADPKSPRPGSTASHYGSRYYGSWQEQLQVMAEYIKGSYGLPSKALESENTRGYY